MVAITRQRKTSARYDLDGLGNWRRFTTDPVGGSLTTQVRQHNGLNEITRAGSTNFSYDGMPGASNGNLANDGTLKYEWDALNRLKTVKRVSDDATIGAYTYDAMNRRIRKVVTNGGLSGTISNGTTDCLYEGWRCVEERNPLGGGGGTDTPTKQYVWGIYLDELIQIKLLVSENNLTTGSYYPLQDLLYRTTALADSSGTLREAYDFDAYGNTLIFRNSGSPPSAITWTDSDTQTDSPTCPFLFTGQRFDAESGNYYYKEREYAPKWGRFLSKDPIVSDPNLYRYVSNNPSRYNDPYGMFQNDCIPNCLAGCDAEYGWYNPQRYVCRSYCDNACTNTPDVWDRFGNLLDQVCREIDSWQNRPGVTCACGLIGIADLATSNPGVEALDCACNIMTTLQTACSRGLSGAAAMASLTALDCSSVAFAALGCPIGAAAGGITGSVPGAIIGCFVGSRIADTVVDIGAMVAQNYDQQGVPWPKAQAKACCELFR